MATTTLMQRSLHIFLFPTSISANMLLENYREPVCVCGETRSLQRYFFLNHLKIIQYSFLGVLALRGVYRQRPPLSVSGGQAQCTK
jgi:hypothetical protein